MWDVEAVRLDTGSGGALGFKPEWPLCPTVQSLQGPMHGVLARTAMKA